MTELAQLGGPRQVQCGMIYHENMKQPIKMNFNDEIELEYWLMTEILKEMRDAGASGIWAFWLFGDLQSAESIWRVVHGAISRSILRDLDDWIISDGHPATKATRKDLRKKVGFGALHFRRILAT